MAETKKTAPIPTPEQARREAFLARIETCTDEEAKLILTTLEYVKTAKAMQKAALLEGPPVDDIHKRLKSHQARKQVLTERIQACADDEVQLVSTVLKPVESAGKAQKAALGKPIYNAYASHKTRKYDSLDSVTAEDLKAAGIVSMATSEWLGKVQTFFVDKDPEFKLTLYARSREMTGVEISELIPRLNAARPTHAGVPREPCVDQAFKRTSQGYTGVKFLHVDSTRVEYVEIDELYVMHDVKVFH